MQIIIDANVIMAMLIKPGRPIDVFFHQSLDLFAPQLLFTELERHKQEIIEKSRLNDEEFEWLYVILKSNVKIIPEEEFVKYRGKAIEICPHQKDVIYFALALHLRCPIWTSEKKLKLQSEVTVYSTDNLMKIFSIN